MKKVALQFQTPQDLTNFRKNVGNAVFKTDVTNLIIYCECTEETIALAITKYGAIVKDIPE